MGSGSFDRRKEMIENKEWELLERLESYRCVVGDRHENDLLSGRQEKQSLLCVFYARTSRKRFPFTQLLF